MLILLSTPVHTILTDQTQAFDQLAATVLRLQQQKMQQQKAQQLTAGSTTASAASASSSASSTADDGVPTVHALLQEHLLQPDELRRVLDALQSDVAALLPARVMNDEMRKKKPTTLA
jgi:hypothetical protein